jgi:hypothetical protein
MEKPAFLARGDSIRLGHLEDALVHRVLMAGTRKTSRTVCWKWVDMATVERVDDAVTCLDCLSRGD